MPGISVEDIKQDLRSYMAFVDSKESQFTGLIGAVMIGVVLSVLLPMFSLKTELIM